MGRGGRGQNEAVKNISASAGFRQPKTRTPEEIKARNTEISSWKDIADSRYENDPQEYLEGFIKRVETINWKKNGEANITRHPDDMAEAYAERVLSEEARDFQVLDNILVEHRRNKGFEDNPEKAPSAEDYAGRDVFALSRTGLEKKQRKEAAAAARKRDNEMTIEEFKTEMKKADWTYEFADDGGIYNRGKASVERIKRLAKGNPDRERVLTDYLGEKWYLS